MISTVDLAWTAGIIEGEGNFCLSAGWAGKRHSPVVSVVQREPEILYRLHAMYGGSIYKYRTDSRPRGSGRVSDWRCFGSTAAGLAMSIYPFMTKHRRATIVRMLGRWRSCKAKPRHPNPTARRVEILRLRAEGKYIREIATTLRIGYGIAQRVCAKGA